MARDEGTGTGDRFIVISSAPDVCKSPDKPVPYQITALLSDGILTSPNVYFQGVPAFHMKSRVSKVAGDEAGVGGGVRSGVNRGFCRPITPVKSVKCNDVFLCRHQYSTFLMNCAGPEGPGNTIGRVFYLGALNVAPVAADGGPGPGGNDPVTPETDEEAGELANRGGLFDDVGDVIVLAKKAYDLAGTDWSDPGDVLGAIAGVAGLAGLEDAAKAAGLARSAYNLATTDWSNPGAAIGAAMGMIGPALALVGDGGAGSSAPTSGEGGDGVLDVLGKIWSLPNSVLGLVLGGTGAAVQELWYQLGMTDVRPGIQFGDNAVEFTDSPSVFSNSAITLGNAIVYAPEFGPATPFDGDTVGGHEVEHTYQSEMLGPLYIPAWVTGAVLAGMQGHDPFGEKNFMESGPYAKPKRSF